MPNSETAILTVDIKYDPEVTDPEGLAAAMDILLKTALSTPGILDEYGNPEIEEFMVWVEPPGAPTLADVVGDDDDDEDEDEVCAASPTGKHEADPNSLTAASGIEFVVDVNCKHCGRSGSAPILDQEIQW